MRNLFIILTAFCVLSGCGNGNKAKKTNTDEALAAFEQAELSPQLVSSIFLGFNFNMSKPDVQKHFSELLQQGKITTDNKGLYAYDFHTEQGSVIANFSEEYYNDTLCCFALKFQTGEGLLGTSELTMQSAIDVFQKQSQGYTFYINEAIESSPSYLFIKSNVVVKFSSLTDAMMRYINAPKYSLLQESKEKAKSDKENSTLSDL